MATSCHEERQAGARALGSLPRQVSREGHREAYQEAQLNQLFTDKWGTVLVWNYISLYGYHADHRSMAVVVFFCYDSYDTWVSASEVDGDLEDPPSTDRPWKVKHFYICSRIFVLKLK